ncbi:hypothetical protein ACFSQ7_39645 [Paenibacillus rhizoplanae]
MARLRDGATSVTLITETPSFFAMRHGSVRLLAVQLNTSFYPGFVPMQEMTRLPEGYLLKGVQKKGYYGPVEGALLPPQAGTAVSPWYLLPHQSRPLTHEQTLSVETEVHRTETGWTIRLHCAEPAQVLAQLSFKFGWEGNFTSGELETLDEDNTSGELQMVDEDNFLWRDGQIRYTSGGDWIDLTGGEMAHLGRTAPEPGPPKSYKNRAS